MDLEKKACMVCRRDNGAKQSIPMDDIVVALPKLLDQIHDDLFGTSPSPLTGAESSPSWLFHY